ncbi:hypothetical protein CRG98_038744, partial [Punica granatum]
GPGSVDRLPMTRRPLKKKDSIRQARQGRATLVGCPRPRRPKIPNIADFHDFPPNWPKS